MLNIKKYIAGILIIWLAAGAISLFLNLYDDRKEREALAFQTARTLLAQLVHTRTWNARHGESTCRYVLMFSPTHILMITSGI